MSFINFAAREINCKIVYYGAGLGGKTTNLQHIFQKNREEATKIMLHVHQKGVGVCGVYTYEIAETKVTQTVDYARKNQHPLQCTLEKE